MTTPASPTGADESDHNPRTVVAGPLTAVWDVTRAAETTLVTVRVTNDGTRAGTVRIENQLDGTVRPPRRNGVPEQGWDADGATCVVPAGETVSLGYACRAPLAEPPLTLAEVSRDVAEPSPVDRALRSLDDHAPPRAAVSASTTVSDGTDASDETDTAATTDWADSTNPVAAPGTSEPEAESDEATTSDAVDAESDLGTPPQAKPSAAALAERAAGDRAASAGSMSVGSAAAAVSDSPPETAVPMTVSAWFRAVDARLDTAARLAGSVEEATPVVASLGGRRGLSALTTTLEADSEALHAVAERARALAARIDEADVPEPGAET
jgi:hypothetical protein